MMTRKIAALAALVVAVPVSAQNGIPDHGWLLGLDVGRHELEIRESTLGKFFDQHAVSWDALAGYQFSRFLAAEVNYYDGGHSDIAGGGATFAVHIRGARPSIVASLPIGEYFALFARGGYSFYRARVRASMGAQSVSTNLNDSDPAFGVGLAFVFDNARVRLEYEQIDYNSISGGSPALQLDPKSKFIKLGVLWSIPTGR